MAKRSKRANFYVLPIEGVIGSVDEKSALGRGSRGTTSSRVEQHVERILKDPFARGVLLRIDSPGGLATASENIFSDLRTLAEKVPLHAHIDGIGASGSYMAACASDVISASPSSIVGSIGVIQQLADYSGLMERIGVKMDILATGAFKGAGAPYRSRTPEELAYFDTLLWKCFERFRDLVLERRSRVSLLYQDEVFSGKVFDAKTAYRYGLIDCLASHREAKAILVMAALGDPGAVTRKTWTVLRPPQPFFQRMFAQSSAKDELFADLHNLLASMTSPNFWYLYRP